MAHVYKEAHRVVAVEQQDPDYFDDSTALAENPVNVLAQVVYFIGGTIMTLLAIRFLLSLFGANTANEIVHFVFAVTQPLVAPFFGLFNTNVQTIVGRFEYETLLAIVGYGLLATAVTYFLSLFDRRSQ